MGKYHNLLYIAMKLAFDWSLQDNGVVAALLDELYACEGTFERIFLGKLCTLPSNIYLNVLFYVYFITVTFMTPPIYTYNSLSTRVRGGHILCL